MSCSLWAYFWSVSVQHLAPKGFGWTRVISITNHLLMYREKENRQVNEWSVPARDSVLEGYAHAVPAHDDRAKNGDGGGVY